VPTRNKTLQRLTAHARVTDAARGSATVAAVAVAEAVHVAPVHIVMRYKVCGTVVLAVAELAVLWAARAWSLDPLIAVCAMIVLSVPWGNTGGSLMPKVMQHIAGK
jgi:hypothetical protein